MLEVWLLFKFFEAILGAICMTFHIVGVLYYTEPIMHHLFYCGTFTGMTLYSIISFVSILFGVHFSCLTESVASAYGAVFYLNASIISLHSQEDDVHLIGLSQFEEISHVYFYNLRLQSLTALVAAATYLLHSIFAFDAMIISVHSFSRDSDASEEAQVFLRRRESISIYFINQTIHEFLSKSKFFQKLTRELGKEPKTRSKKYFQEL